MHFCDCFLSICVCVLAARGGDTRASQAISPAFSKTLTHSTRACVCVCVSSTGFEVLCVCVLAARVGDTRASQAISPACSKTLTHSTRACVCVCVCRTGL